MGDVHTKKAKVVCAKCNNGWMNEIVGAAKPVVTQVVLGRFGALNAAAQKKLATWLALQAMMADLLTKEPVKLPRSDLDYLYRKREPPPEMFIGIGRYAGPSHVAFDHTCVPIWGRDGDAEPVLQVSLHTMCSIIGGLYAIQTRSSPALTPDMPAGEYWPYVIQLWPIVHSDISWPSPVQFWIQGDLVPDGGLARALSVKLGNRFYAEMDKLISSASH
ncbi:hypothetical protein ACQR0Z_25675 [Bradyrhizobium sp. HKCCYLS3077]|uniref:hypothetical protein n=1 Tax=Bradyrhizobium sp. HKCCYLS3077 TaxID=3420761 RepID=UPI003EC00EBE